MSFLTQMRYRLQQWMYGRNGIDVLSRDLNILALAFMLLDYLLKTHIINWLGLLILAVNIYRICSRNIAKRATENQAYLTFKGHFENWFIKKKKLFSDRKYYRFYKCSSCKQKLRVPKGKGKIEITCPKCGLHFVKKT